MKTKIGTLNDEDILDLCTSGKLITADFKKENIKQACYELRAGNIYYDLSNGNIRIDIAEDDYKYILLKPKQSIVIITKEALGLPNDIIGRILTKGKLFSIGLLPVNTYADPGFIGNLGIVFYNSSNNYLKISAGEAIAKVEFSRLEHPVVSRYSGQHGYETRIWPIPLEYSLNSDQINSDKRIGTTIVEIEQAFGSRYAFIIQRLLGVEKKLILATIFYLTFSFLLLGVILIIDKKDWFSPFYGILLGLVSNVVSFVVIARLEKSKWFNAK